MAIFPLLLRPPLPPFEPAGCAPSLEVGVDEVPGRVPVPDLVTMVTITLVLSSLVGGTDSLGAGGVVVGLLFGGGVDSGGGAGVLDVGVGSGSFVGSGGVL